MADVVKVVLASPSKQTQVWIEDGFLSNTWHQKDCVGPQISTGGGRVQFSKPDVILLEGNIPLIMLSGMPVPAQCKKGDKGDAMVVRGGTPFDITQNLTWTVIEVG